MDIFDFPLLMANIVVLIIVTPVAIVPFLFFKNFFLYRNLSPIIKTIPNNIIPTFFNLQKSQSVFSVDLSNRDNLY